MPRSFLLFALSFTLFVNIASAATTNTVPGGLKENLTTLGNSANYTTIDVTEKNLFSTVGSLVGIFLSTLGVIFAILFIVAGYNWMMAGGDTAKLDKAKDGMWRAIIGLLIIISAYAIQQYVFTRL